MAAIMLYVLSILYIRYGSSLSNRKSLAGNFVLIGVTTMIIITIVKSSLALSLGLVGALSIVRFRTAIKEPEELAFIFLTISIGLGLGADQKIVTLVGFLFVTLLIIIGNYWRVKDENKNIHLMISGKCSGAPQSNILEEAVTLIGMHSNHVNMKRYDQNSEAYEISVLLELKDFNDLNKLKQALIEYDSEMSISILDNKGLAS